MVREASSRVDIAPLGPVSCATGLWQTQGQLHVTVIVKASFSLAEAAGGRAGAQPPEAMSIVDAEDILRAEVHHANNPTRSVRLTGDLAPYMPRADVLLTGHASSPGGRPVPAMTVRLAVLRDEPLLDKTIHVRGDAGPDGPQPFARMPLVYERAFGGIGWKENPFGVGAGVGGRVGAPNLFDPEHPDRVTCFAPISRGWSTRKRLLGGTDRKALDGPIAQIPAGFDWTYYQAAPPDQQIPYLIGDERIVIEGVHPSLVTLEARLPGARGAARVYGLGDGGTGRGRPLRLNADMLRIDADLLRCDVVWRSSFPVPGEDALAAIRILVGVEREGQPIEWPATHMPLRTTVPLPAGRDAAHPTAAGRTPSAVDLPPKHLAPPAPPSSEGDDDDYAETADLPGAARAPDNAQREPALVRTLTLLPEEELQAAQRPATAFESKPSAPRPEPTPAAQRWVARTPKKKEENPLSGTTIAGDDDSGGPPTLPFATPRPTAPPRPTPTEELAPRWRPEPEPEPAPEPWVAERKAAPGPAPARRSPEGILFVAPPSLAVATIPWRMTPARDCITVIAKVTCDLVPGGPAKPRDESEAPSGEVTDESDAARGVLHPSDLAPFKVRADVTLTGHAYAQAGFAPSAEVSFRLGHADNGFERRILVFGERRWKKAAPALEPTAPESFQCIPICYGRAFGGAGFDANPTGVGHYPRGRSAAGRLLPNLEDPAGLICSPNQEPAPACFGPLPIRWKERWAGLGWKRKGWPWLPEQLDWTHWQVAPASQQLYFLQGDEPFECVGLHPQHAALAGTLPGMRVRCFAERKPAAAGRLEEIPFRLDTAAFSLDDLKLTLVWRGVLEVNDEAAPDVAAVYFLIEDLSAAPATLAQARAKLLRG